jgi:hypothetical protein
LVPFFAFQASKRSFFFKNLIILSKIPGILSWITAGKCSWQLFLWEAWSYDVLLPLWKAQEEGRMSPLGWGLGVLRISDYVVGFCIFQCGQMMGVAF